MEAKVKTVETQNSEVVVNFTDGYEARFEPYSHGWGYAVEGLRRFHLRYNGETVCEYNARLYRFGPRNDENKIKFLQDGYTQQQVAAYWETAGAYLNAEYFKKERNKENEHLWYPWMLVCTEGSFDLQRLSQGCAEFLSEE